MQKYQVNVSMDGRYNFITIFYFLTFKDPYPLEILVAIKFSSRFPLKSEQVKFVSIPCLAG